MHRIRRTSTVLVALAVATFALEAEGSDRAANDSAYALHLSTSIGGDFVTHSVGTFDDAMVLGTNESLIVGMDFDPEAAVLYAFDNGFSSEVMELGTIDPADGSFTTIGPSATFLPGHDHWGGFTVDPVTGTIWATSFDNDAPDLSALYTLDSTTGEASYVGFNELDYLATLAMNCEGELYGVDLATDSLYAVSTADGTVTEIGPLGLDVTYAQDMDFDSSSGILYAWAFDGSTLLGHYGTIDVTTGAFTEISELGDRGEYSGAIRTTCSAIFSDGFESGDTSAWSVP